MPNDNLGVAHGRIQISVDDRGTAQATAALVQMQAQFEKMNKTLSRIDRSLKSTDVELEKTTRQVARAEKAARGYSSTMWDTRKEVKAFSRDTRDVINDIRYLYDILGKANRQYKKFATGIRLLNAAGMYERSGLGQQRALLVSINDLLAKGNKRIQTFNKGFNSLTIGDNPLANLVQKAKFFDQTNNNFKVLRASASLTGASYITLRERILGVGDAVNTAPSWVRKLYQFQTVVAKTAGAAGLLAVAISPLVSAQNLIGTNFYKRMIAGIDKAGKKTAGFGSIVERVFGQRGRSIVEGFAETMQSSGSKIDNVLIKNSKNLENFRDKLSKGALGVREWITPYSRAIGGVALLTSSVNKLWTRLQWFFKLPKPLMAGLALFFSRVMPTALYGTRKALQGVSNVMAGLWDGIKQLTGGLNALPGLIAGITVAVTSFKLVFNGIGDLFEDLFSTDPMEVMEAWWKLPDYLKPLGSVLKDLAPKFRELRKSLQIEAFRNVEKQIESLASVYLPLLERNAGNVVGAMRRVKDGFVDFLNVPKTRADFASIYTSTAAGIDQIARATKPAMLGLRDMATVGAKFFKDILGWAPYLSNKFREWAELNRDTGQSMKWMTEARKGIYELSVGLRDATKGLFGFLTLFQTKPDDNWLRSFAASMKRFDEVVTESSISGKLKNLRKSVADLGSQEMEKVKDLFRIFGDLFESLQEPITNLTNAFSGPFTRGMKIAFGIIEQVMKVFSGLGLDKAVGTWLGFMASFKLLPNARAAVFEFAQAIGGMFSIMKNKQKVLEGFEIAMTWISEKMAGKFGDFGNRVSKGLDQINTSTNKLLNNMLNLAAVFPAVFTAAMALWSAWSAGRDQIKEFNKIIDQQEKNLITFGDKVRKAFYEDSGLTGRNVIDTVKNGLETSMQEVETLADKVPGFWDNIQDLFYRSGGSPVAIGQWFEQSDAFNELQAESEAAKLAAASFKKLRDAHVDLSAYVTASDDTYERFTKSLRDSGKEGAAAADKLDILRDELKRNEEVMKLIGAEGMGVADAINQIAEASNNAAAALDGLKQLLEDLGFIQTTAVQQQIDWANALRDVSKEIQAITTDADTAGQALLSEDGGFNYDTEAGVKFAQMLVNLSEEFLATATATGNAQAAFDELRPRLQEIATLTGIPIEKLQELTGTLGMSEGLNPLIDMATSLKGKSKELGDFFEVWAQGIKNIASGTTAEIIIDPDISEEDFAKKINELVGKNVATADTDKRIVTISPQISQQDLDKILVLLREAGINVPNEVTAKPSLLPVVPTIADESGKPITPGNLGGLLGAGEGINTEGVEEAVDELGKIIGAASDDSLEGGRSFSKNFAEGIEDNIDLIRRAADTVLKEARDRVKHGSPPKKGPLSGRGWSGYGGMAFTRNFAEGMLARRGEVAAAANEVAGAAGNNLKGDAAYEAGQFLGQLSQLNQFFANVVTTFGKVAQSILQIAKFTSDPLGKGTFFGKRLGFRRDPNVTDEQLAQRSGDRRQQGLFGFYGSAQRPDIQIDPMTGRRLGGQPGTLNPSANEQEVANFIIDKALSLGYSREQANQFLIQAVGESGLNPDASNPNGWNGIFQFDKQTWDLAGGGNVLDAQENIENYFNLTAQRGLTPENFKNPSQLGIDVSIGGPLHPENAAKGHLDKAQAAAQQYINGYQQFAGQTVDGILGGIPAAIGNLPKPSKLGTGPGFVAAGMSLAAVLEQRFPGITNMGGQQNRPAGTPQIHTQGRALDVGIGSNLALGDEINAFVQANAGRFGVQSTIWRDIGKNLVDNEGGPAGSTYKSGGHFDHVHIQFANGATADVGPDGVMTFNVPQSVNPGPDFGLPEPPEARQSDLPPKELVTRNPDPNGPPFIPVHSGTGDEPGTPVKINPSTGKPWTPQETADLYNQPGMELQYDATELINPSDVNAPGLFQGTQEEMLDALKAQYPILSSIDAGIKNNFEGMTLEQAQAQAEALNPILDALEAQGTPASRAMFQAVEGMQSAISSEFGLAQISPLDIATQIGDSVVGIASDIFNVIGSAIETIGTTKEFADTLVRGVANTEDLFNIVDHIQQFIKFGADVAGAVSSITSAMATIVGASSAASGGGDAGGGMAAATALQGLSAISSFIQSGLEAFNAVVDLGQEAYRIIGSYVGDFLGYLTGGAAGQLAGNVKFLLDEKTNELLAYSVDNPGDKRSHNLPFQNTNPDARNQQIGTINVYGGPGQDPRDNTRQMMFQVKAAQFAAPTGQ